MRKNNKRYIYKIEITKILLKSILFVFSLILVTFYMTSSILAKYKSESSTNDTARVAKFGELSFYEYSADTGQLVGDAVQIENITIKAGTDIDKKISLSFSGSEVATYIYLIVETSGWSITTNTESNINRLSIKNAGKEDMVYWELNNKWTYLDGVSNDSTFVFYHLIEPNTSFTDDVMTALIVNSISLDDVNLLKTPDYSITVKTHAVSAAGNTPEQAWEHISE